jgi:nucleoside-diphosphate-sugar epimerase
MVFQLPLCLLVRPPILYDQKYDLVVDHEVPIRPDSFYGSLKVFGEVLCRQYVEYWDRRCRFIALRSGSLHSPKYDHPYGNAERGVTLSIGSGAMTPTTRTVDRMSATLLSR